MDFATSPSIRGDVLGVSVTATRARLPPRLAPRAPRTSAARPNPRPFPPNPAISAAATPCRGRRRDGRVPYRPAGALDPPRATPAAALRRRSGSAPAPGGRRRSGRPRSGRPSIAPRAIAKIRKTSSTVRSRRTVPAALASRSGLLEQLARSAARSRFRWESVSASLRASTASAVEVDHPVDQAAEEDEEGVGVALVLGGERRDPLDVLVEDLRGEGAAVGEVAVERRPGRPRRGGHLAHRDVGGVGEELARGLEDRRAVVPRVPALLVGRGRERHARQGSNRTDAVRYDWRCRGVARALCVTNKRSWAPLL